jgi:hypothetical protein
MNNLQEHKDEVGPGWHFLIDALDNFVKMKQRGYLRSKNGKFEKPFEKPEKDLFDFDVFQIKEKFSQLRIHADCRAVEHNWEIFDKENYNERLGPIQDEIYGFIQALDCLSGFICEECGQRGEMCKIGGWMKTYCSKCRDEALNIRGLIENSG